MFLQRLDVLNYKNCESAQFHFDEKVNCLVGRNGAGKTNALDAIYYLAFSKSFFNPSDSQNIKTGELFFSIQGLFNDNENTEKIDCSVKSGHKKAMRRNNKQYEKLSDHIGLIPLVMISPIDILLIIEGSDGRRKWLDGLIAQFDKKYLQELLSYNRILTQRNASLKQFQPYPDAQMIELYNDQLVEHGSYIYEKRKEIMAELISLFNEYYNLISQSSEEVGISYISQLESDLPFMEQLKESFQKDCRNQYTNVGIHKDDIEWVIEDRPVKKFASQGQQKTVLLSLRLAQAKLIHRKTEKKPLMLLDDVHDKLDTERMQKMLEILKSEEFGQMFITDTNFEHMQGLLDSVDLRGKFFQVDNGQIELINTKVEVADA